jgi:hypothetical protein
MSSQVPRFIGAVEDGEHLGIILYKCDADSPLLDWAMFRCDVGFGELYLSSLIVTSVMTPPTTQLMPPSDLEHLVSSMLPPSRLKHRGRNRGNYRSAHRLTHVQ